MNITFKVILRYWTQIVFIIGLGLGITKWVWSTDTDLKILKNENLALTESFETKFKEYQSQNTKDHDRIDGMLKLILRKMK